MTRLGTRYALCALSVFSGAIEAQATGSLPVVDYAAIAAADYRSLPSRLARLAERSTVEVVADCAQLAASCRRLRPLKSDTGYEARLLDAASYVALLPNEVKVRGAPYYAWIPVGGLKVGAAVLARWRALATEHASLGCQAVEECTHMVLQPPDDRRAASTISACRADSVNDPPRTCDAVAVLANEGSWLRTMIGWGSGTVATQLQPSPIVEDFEVERRLSILQLPTAKRGAIVQALETGLQASPLLLATELRPPVNPNAVKGRRATELSLVIQRFREWASVRADLDPPVTAAADTTVSTIELTATLWLSISASPQPTRPANAAESARYVATVLANVTREIARVCGAPFVGARVVCR